MKKVIALLTALTLMITTLPAMAAGAIAASVDFEDQTKDATSLSLSSSCGLTWTKHSSTSHTVVSENDNLFLRVKSGNSRAFELLTFPTCETDLYELTFSIRLGAKSIFRLTNHITGSNGAYEPLLFFDGDGVLSAYSGNAPMAQVGSTYNYEANTWYNIKLQIDLTNKTYNAFIGDTRIGTEDMVWPKHQNSTTSDHIDMVRFDFGVSSSSCSKNLAVDIDNVKLEKMVLTFNDSTVENNTVGFAVNGEIGLNYNYELEAFDKSKISVVPAEGGEPADFSASIDGETLKISFAENLLDFKTEYTLTVSEGALTDTLGRKSDGAATLSFTTMEESLVCGIPYFETAEEDGETLENTAETDTVYVKAKISNFTSNPQNAVLAVSIYGENGFEKTITMPAQIGKAKEPVIFVKAEGCSGKTIKAVCLSDTDSFKVLCEGYAEIDGEGSRVAADNSTVSPIVISDGDSTEETVSVKALAGDAAQIVIIGVKKDGAVLAVEPVETQLMETEEEASYGVNYIYKVPEADRLAEKELSYDFVINSRLAESKGNHTEKYIGTTVRNSVKDAVNNAASENDVEAAFAPYKAYTKLSEEAFAENNYKIVLEQKPYESFEQACAMLKTAAELESSMSGLLWTDMTEFLEKNGDILLNGVEEYDDYKNLSEKNKNKVNQNFCEYESPVSADDFREKFEDAYEEYLESKKTSSSNNSGGSPKKTSGVKSNISSQKTEEEQTNTGIDSSETEEPSGKKEFSDISNAEWAKDAITHLADKGVISGYPDGSFKPKNEVKREEFIKMLISAFEIKAESEAKGFADCEKGLWYEEFVHTAQAAGIAKGDENGLFGIGRGISRQDAAVMVWRTLDVAGKALPQETEVTDFSDTEDIRDYAKEAVTSLCRAGILNGMDDGSFRPEEITTRAQVAKIIYEVLCAVTEEVK